MSATKEATTLRCVITLVRQRKPGATVHSPVNPANTFAVSQGFSTGRTSRQIRAPRTPHRTTGQRGQGRVATKSPLPQIPRQLPNLSQAQSECLFSGVRPEPGAGLRALPAACRIDLRLRALGAVPPWIWLPGFSGWNRRVFGP